MIDLKPYNTFGVSAKTPHLITVESKKALIEALQLHPNALILGKGSNILFTKDLQQPVIVIANKGITTDNWENDLVKVTAAAGESWDDLVQYTLSLNLCGLENLSLIPSSVGAAPIQNIGAYGVEQNQFFESCLALDCSNLTWVQFSREECQFGYRNSFFKNEGKGRFIIWEVSYVLPSKAVELNITYAPLKNYFEEHPEIQPTPKKIAELVIEIRKSKLPDPNQQGNAGSFFKNPVIKEELALQLKREFNDLPLYPASDGVKVAAGWLIEKAGFKGYFNGDAGVHDKQALVLVNKGGASGKEIANLSVQIQKKVFDQFRIRLEPEVTIL
ncbi:MAG: UDP-N-acetylmuramate dehydrogenase [Flavobacteriaceae bacterium]